jgi:hypothetical protein
MPNGEEYHGEDARKYIEKNKREEFDAYVPKHVDTDEIWNIFYPNAELDNFIEETSTMSGGVGS